MPFKLRLLATAALAALTLIVPLDQGSWRTVELAYAEDDAGDASDADSADAGTGADDTGADDGAGASENASDDSGGAQSGGAGSDAGGTDSDGGSATDSGEAADGGAADADADAGADADADAGADADADADAGADADADAGADASGDTETDTDASASGDTDPGADAGSSAEAGGAAGASGSTEAGTDPSSPAEGDAGASPESGSSTDAGAPTAPAGGDANPGGGATAPGASQDAGAASGRGAPQAGSAAPGGRGAPQAGSAAPETPGADESAGERAAERPAVSPSAGAPAVSERAPGNPGAGASNEAAGNGATAGAGAPSVAPVPGAPAPAGRTRGETAVAPRVAVPGAPAAGASAGARITPQPGQPAAAVPAPGDAAPRVPTPGVAAPAAPAAPAVPTAPAVVAEPAPVASAPAARELSTATRAPRIALGSGSAPSFRQYEVAALGMTPRARNTMRSLGFRIVSERRSPLLGNRLVSRLRTPGTQSAESALAQLRNLFPELIFDYTHLYRPSQGAPVTVSYGAELVGLSASAAACRADTRIGLIDTGLVRHETLAGAEITQRAFLDRDAGTNVVHGTAIASILVGELPGAAALAPGARLYSANVFAGDQGRVRSDVTAIIAALDWMAAQQVRVVNLSLMGPDNALLRAAVLAAAQRGQILLAAVGNDGPTAPPAYPAAYDAVIGVAAVDARGRPYAMNNRGSYVEVAAPGVDIWGADARGGEAFWTGTSFAVPFATAAVARAVATGEVANVNDARAMLARSARDLGAPGRDPVYGHGLLQVDSCR